MILIYLCLITAAACKNLRTHTETVEYGIPFGNMLLGPLMFVLAIPLTWFNYKQIARNYQTAKEIRENYHTSNPDKPYDGIVYISGRISSPLNCVKTVKITQIRKYKSTTISGEDVSSVVWETSNTETTYSDAYIGQHKLSNYILEKIDGKTYESESIGNDTKIRYVYHQPGVVSVLAACKNGIIRPHIVDVGAVQCCAICQVSQCVATLLMPIYSIAIVKEGVVEPESMLDEIERDNRSMGNIGRLVSFIMLVMGIMLFMSPMTSMMGYVPVVGWKALSSMTVLVAAVVISLLVYLAVTGIAWMYYRPTLGALMVLVTVLVFGWLVYGNRMAHRHW